MTTHEYYMHKALQEARQAAEEGEIPVGAVVVCKGKIIARAHNETEKLNDVTAHAECSPSRWQPLIWEVNT